MRLPRDPAICADSNGILGRSSGWIYENPCLIISEALKLKPPHATNLESTNGQEIYGGWQKSGKSYRPRSPRMCERYKQPTKRDRRIYSDDIEIKTTKPDEIYPELTTFGKTGGGYRIEINWVAIVRLVRNRTGTTTEKYQGIHFKTHGNPGGDKTQ